MIRHRNTVNLFTGMDLVLGREPAVWLGVTSISFDLSVTELFWTLTRGLRVVIQGSEATDARLRAKGQARTGVPSCSIAEQICAMASRTCNAHPSLAGMMAQDPETLRAFRNVKQFLFGGEAVPPKLVEQLGGLWRKFSACGARPNPPPGRAFIPSRATAASSLWAGRLPNTQIYVLDRHLQPLADGVTGEIYVGGAGVVRGYLNRPDLTAERFLPDPFRNKPGARIYSDRRPGALQAGWNA